MTINSITENKSSSAEESSKNSEDEKSAKECDEYWEEEKGIKACNISTLVRMLIIVYRYILIVKYYILNFSFLSLLQKMSKKCSI